MANAILYPEEGTLSALDSWLQGLFGPAIARLYDNNVVYLPTRTLADYNEASFVGYAPVGPISWPTPSINPDGKAQADSPTLDFHFSGSTGTAVVYGLFFTDDPPTRLMAVAPFLDPVTLSPGNRDLAEVARMTTVSELNG